MGGNPSLDSLLNLGRPFSLEAFKVSKFYLSLWGFWGLEFESSVVVPLSLGGAFLLGEIFLMWKFYKS